VLAYASTGHLKINKHTSNCTGYPSRQFGLITLTKIILKNVSIHTTDKFISAPI
jgi:hypothetical protein